MLEKIMNTVEQAKKLGRAMEFDPSVFDDPIAKKAHWTRLKRNNTNFKSRNLKEVSPGRLEYKSSMPALLFSLVFMVIGAGIPLWYVLFYHDSSADIQTILFPFIFGIIFFGVGFYFFNSKRKPIVIDKTAGLFWIGKNDPSTWMENDSAVRLSDIHAVQLLSEFVRGEKRSYYVYETNFVLKDGGRVNVVSQGGPRNSSMAEAQKLANFLDVPIWDAS